MTAGAAGMTKGGRALTLETERLQLRPLTQADAPFLVEQLNDADFLRNIGDRGVRTLAQARVYIEDGPVASYRENGHGLLMVELRETGDSIGTCGLIRRDFLEHADVGFAFLRRHRRRGYAFEAASAAMEHGRRELGLDPILAIVSSGNWASIRLLEKLGLRFVEDRVLPDADRVLLFSTAGPG